MLALLFLEHLGKDLANSVIVLTAKYFLNLRRVDALVFTLLHDPIELGLFVEISEALLLLLGLGEYFDAAEWVR